jgi:hypothetical protein
MPESMIEGRAFDRFCCARGQGMSRCIVSAPFDELHGTVSGDLLKSRVQCPGADARGYKEFEVRGLPQGGLQGIHAPFAGIANGCAINARIFLKPVMDANREIAAYLTLSPFS